ncbi:IF-2B-domain-containing protein [Dendrothele bispora CBS 962.96]|uniref:Translation initiation factor eIF2B subunit delta n=1 Tax=Dendrothele bispora (strain CBS 962.96) TaxID=1314807 RepID=A0A4S8MQX2_DENBC|nr:IF-2B-domain-containing protein [Dendrothele bispora CBS 962.96]
MSEPSKDGPPTPLSSSQPSQKSMTKAERRELQERQRAAKAAQKQQQGQGQGQASSSASSRSKAQGAPQKKSESGRPRASSSAAPTSSRDVGGAARDGSGGIDSEGPKTRGLRIFSHFGLPKTSGHQVKGDIHPAIIRLGLQFSEFKICGANARCIAMLTAFKTVIQDYTTPAHNTLSRHLMTYLSPQISHLVAARPMSVTMGNAIRQLKLEISGSDIDLPEQDAKDALCHIIDNYIRDRIIIADEVIEDLAVKKIKDGDVVMTYARSSLVEKILIRAHALNKRFSVIVLDSRPLLEGKTLLRTLTSTTPPISCTYALLPALPSLIKEVSVVLVGAHSLHTNGSVYSRAGTAMVAMLAKEHSVPVMVCCETYKFSESIMLDAFGKNELAPLKFSPPEAPKPHSNLEVLDPLYDSTPPTCITAVVTEVGLIPPTSISSIPLALGKTSL